MTGLGNAIVSACTGAVIGLLITFLVSIFVETPWGIGQVLAAVGVSTFFGAFFATFFARRD